MIPLCRYILQGGNSCQQAAITGENYCRHHLVVRRTVAANTPNQNPYRVEKPLTLVFPEDRAAQQINIFVVMQAFNEGQISPKSATILTRLLHECSVNLRQGPLYDSDHQNAVRRVIVTPEGEEIAPAREVPEGGEEVVSGEAVSEEAVSGEAVSGETVSQEAVSGEAVSQEAVSGEAVSNEAVSNEAASGGAVGSSPTSQKRDVGHPHPQTAREGRGTQSSVPAPHASSDSVSVPPPDDFGGCKDPCYIENLTQRREQYRKLATYELAAGLDPRPWENFIPGKSKVKRPKTLVG